MVDFTLPSVQRSGNGSELFGTEYQTGMTANTSSHLSNLPDVNVLYVAIEKKECVVSNRYTIGAEKTRVSLKIPTNGVFHL